MMYTYRSDVDESCEEPDDTGPQSYPPVLEVREPVTYDSDNGRGEGHGTSNSKGVQH